MFLSPSGRAQKTVWSSLVLGSAMFAFAGDAVAAPDGATAFRLRCASCHSAAAGQPNRVGPNLFGVVGRSSGAVAGFRYSEALKGGKIRWTEQALDRFLENPVRAAPGTSMMGAVAQQADRTQLIAFLKASAVAGR